MISSSWYPVMSKKARLAKTRFPSWTMITAVLAVVDKGPVFLLLCPEGLFGTFPLADIKDNATERPVRFRAVPGLRAP